MATEASGSASRYGGEEFAVILPNTSKKEAISVAEKMRHAIKAAKLQHVLSAVSDYVTVSAGVAMVEQFEESSPQTFIQNADQALYTAKKSGRDRVIAH